MCAPIISPEAGERVIQRVMDYGDYHGTTIDCVWQVSPYTSINKERGTSLSLDIDVVAQINASIMGDVTCLTAH